MGPKTGAALALVLKENRAAGGPWRPIGERVQRLSETIQVLVAGGDTIGLEMIQADGTHERIKD
jgi:hypothetical protein